MTNNTVIIIIIIIHYAFKHLWDYLAIDKGHLIISQSRH